MRARHRPRVSSVAPRSLTIRKTGAAVLPLLFRGEEGAAAWKMGRRRILQAILQRDEELARFEAERYRKDLLTRLRDYQEIPDSS